VKSPLSMNFGRISTSKCRGKLQKMPALYTHSPKSPGTFPKLPKKYFFIFIFISKKLGQPDWSRRRPAAGGRPMVTRRPHVDAWTYRAVPIFVEIFFFLPSTFCTSGQLFLIGCSTCPPCPDFSLKLQTSITFDL
jgi:hypothetical protein